MLRSLVLVCAGIFGTAVQLGAAAADFSPQVWINPGIYSYHLDRDTDYREDNVGFGVEVLITDDHMIMGGSFINSNGERSRYGLYTWRPLHWEVSTVRFSAGISLAALDGYTAYHNGDWFVAPVPLLAIEWKRLGVNFTFVPKVHESLDTAIGIQVKLRVW